MSTLVALLVVCLPQSPVDYPTVTNNYREVPNFNVEPVRAMALANDGTTLFALNSHGSQYVRQDGLSTAAPEEIVQTILNPTAIALWRSPAATTSDEDRVLVVGGGTHALAMHDRTTGEILDVLMLDSEPADIVIVPPVSPSTDHFAFVACQGDNTVQRIDLVAFQVDTGGTIEIPAERPRFLYHDTATSGVFVTSFLSGNGSVPYEFVPGEAAVYDSHNLPILGSYCELPDQDVFWLDATGTSNAVTLSKTQVGTLVTAVGRYPSSSPPGALWVLNVDSKNQSSHGVSEPDIRGDFVDNRVFISSSTATTPQTSDTNNVLSQTASGGPYPFAFPFGLAFEPADPTTPPRAFITSPLNDRVAVCDSTGAPTGPGRIDLPAGSIPLSALVGGGHLFVHCWGKNTVRAYALSGLTLVRELELGLDPTPEPIRQGREIWYDGERSEGGRSSCNSCHPGGKADFLGWQISDAPTDFKNVMVTQSLLGIEDTFPYHWRGERALIDFNGAFVDLLGGASKLTIGDASEFEKFQAFVFSLQPHANPRQALSRQVQLASEMVTVFDHPSGLPVTVTGDGVSGLNRYQVTGGLNESSCEGCHNFETGSNNDFTSETPSFTPSKNTLEVPHLRELRHKDQPLANVRPGCESFRFPRTGFGVAHSGIETGILEFLDRRQDEFNLNSLDVAHVMAFVKQFDQGIAPRSHFAVIVDRNRYSNLAIVENLMRDQAESPRRWIDIVAFGYYTEPGSSPANRIFGRFLYVDLGASPTAMEFDCSNQATRMTLADLDADILNGTASLVFLGVPPGSGRRFALDPDNDELTDFDESTLGTDPWKPSTDSDWQPDGYEVNNGGNPLNGGIKAIDTTPPSGNVTLDFATACMAKYEITANEPVKVRWTFSGPGGSGSGVTPVYARTHTVVVQGLDPSTPAIAPAGGTATSDVVFTLVDLAGLEQGHEVSVDTDPMLHPESPTGGAIAQYSPLILENLVVVPSLTGTSPNKTLTLTASANVRQRYDVGGAVDGGAAGGRAVLFQVVRETVPNSNLYETPTTSWTATPTSPSTSLTSVVVQPGAGGATITPLPPGPYLRAAPDTGTSGAVSLQVAVSNLSSQQRVRLRLVAIGTETSSGSNVFTEASMRQFLFPPTKAEDRVFEYTVP